MSKASPVSTDKGTNVVNPQLLPPAWLLDAARDPEAQRSKVRLNGKEEPNVRAANPDRVLRVKADEPKKLEVVRGDVQIVTVKP